MHDQLDQLYYGEINPVLQFKPLFEQIDESRQKTAQVCAQLRQKFEPDLQKELDDLMSAHSDLTPSENRQAFTEGFKLGARLMAEIYD